MALILNLETATRICSVALAKSGEVLQQLETDQPNAHSRVLAEYVNKIFELEGLKPSEIDAIAVSMGPGSYTGLRIGVSTAKGLSYGLDKPLIAVPTLMAMAACATRSRKDADFFCPMIDARRMEVYTAVFDKDLNELEKTSASIIDGSSFQAWLDKGRVLFFGDGAEKCRDVIKHPNALFDSSIHPSATCVAEIAENKLKNGDTEDVAYFEPFYLKDFVAGKAKVKGLFD